MWFIQMVILTWVHTRHDILPKISGLCERHIFVVRKGYNLKKLRFSGLFLCFQVILGLLRRHSSDG